ncbi:MAG: PAS domain S-box protein, partial [Actinomycetota bacterium]
MRTFFHLLYLWATAGCIFIGLQVYLKDRNSRVNRIFALLCLSMTCWAFINAEFYYSLNLEMAGFWLLFAALWPLPSSVLLHFVLVYTHSERHLEKSSMALLVYLPSIALIAIVQLLGGYTINEPPMYWGWSYSDPDTLAAVLELLVMFGLNATGMMLCLVHYIRQRDAIKKQQAGLILIGLSFPLLAGVLGYSLLPSLGINVPELSVFGFVIGTGTFTGYAIWKYQLFDVTPATAAEMIIATMPGALLLVDAQGNILTANEPALRMLGYGKQSLIGQSVNKVLANDMNPPEIQTSDISGKDFQDTETRLLAKSGEMVPVSLSKASMKDASGHLVGAVLIAHDITERKSAEQTLQMRDEEFRALVEHTSDMVIRFDLGRRITYMNSACRKAFNIAANEFPGMTCGQSGLPAKLANAWDKAVRQVIETSVERKLEHELPNSGGVINYDTRLTPEFSEDGNIESVLVVTRDITEHVNA